MAILCSGNENAAAIVAEWKAQMGRIATDCPNVVVKVGAAGFPVMGIGYDSRDKPPTSQEVAGLFTELYMWTIQAFGAERCMFEGNFPVESEFVV